MDSLKDRIRTAKQKLKNVDVTVTDLHGFEVVERRREDGAFETPVELHGTRRRAVETRRHQGFVLVDLQMAKCGERLYVGSEDVAKNWEILREHGVTHVVNCASRVENWFPHRLEYLQVNIMDIFTANIKQHLSAVLQFMRKAIEGGGTVFVHCNAGISRSTSFVIAYLMRFEGFSYEEALAEVRKERTIARPNDGFVKQLKEFEQELRTERNKMESLADRLRQARRKLNVVETNVTREDGTEVVERRGADGSFATRERSNRQQKKLDRRRRLGFVVDDKPDLQVAQCAEGLFVGSQDVAHDFELLCSTGITHILNCASAVRNSFAPKLRYFNVNVLDEPSMNIRKYFPDALAFMRKAIDEDGGKVFVHCNAGISRSTTFVIAYLMKFEELSLAEALDRVRRERPIAKPNNGFMDQLKEFEVELSAEKSE